MAIDMAEKTVKKATSANDRRKPVKIIVKPIYAGKQDMSEVFGSVALDNIRRKMQER